MRPGQNKRKELTGVYLGHKLREVIKMGEENKKWWQSKTLIVNALTGIAGVLTALTSDKALDPQVIGYLITLLGLVNMGLRMITDKPIGK